MVLEGTYHLAEPFVLTAEDSGTPQQPIRYTAYPGHHPVLSGGKVIDNWKPLGQNRPNASARGEGGHAGSSGSCSSAGSVSRGPRWPNPIPADPLYSGWAFIEPSAANGERRPNAIATSRTSLRGGGRGPSRRK